MSTTHLFINLLKELVPKNHKIHRWGSVINHMQRFPAPGAPIAPFCWHDRNARMPRWLAADGPGVKFFSKDFCLDILWVLNYFACFFFFGSIAAAQNCNSWNFENTDVPVGVCYCVSEPAVEKWPKPFWTMLRENESQKWTLILPFLSHLTLLMKSEPSCNVRLRHPLSSQVASSFYIFAPQNCSASN